MNKYILTVAAALCLLGGCGTEPTKQAESKPTVSVSAETPHAISPESDRLYHEAAKAYGKGHHTEALSLANQALKADEENYMAHSLKGIILAFDVSPDAGIKEIDRALSLRPDYTQAHYDMAMAQKLGGHYDESILHFRKVLEKDPKNTWSLYGIATNYADKHDKENALKYLREAAALGGADVRNTAASQEHFAWLREDEEFRKMISGN